MSVVDTAMAHTESFHQRPPQDLIIRVDLIPIGTSCEELEGELKLIIASKSELQSSLESIVVNSIAPRDDSFACATVTVRSRLHEDKLLSCLQQASKALPFTYDCTFYGITPLVGGSDAHYDVIAVSGLASHAIGSWKCPGGNDVWLRDWLATDIPNIRVLIYGYNTKLLQSRSRSSIEDLGRQFLESLTAFRTSDKTERRPLILIGHSLGGLVIKEALVHAYRSPGSNPMHRLLSSTCCGLLFFGVPQLGLRNDKLMTLVDGQPNQKLIQALVVDDESEPSDFLSRLSDDFAHCYQGRLRVVCFYERWVSPTVELRRDGMLSRTGPPVLMVTRKSATSTGLTAVPREDIVAMEADHSGIVKFSSRRQDEYVIVKERIKSLLSSASSSVEELVGNKGPQDHHTARIYLQRSVHDQWG